MKNIILQFDAKQDFQLKAIDAVVSVFEGQPLGKGAAASLLSYTMAQNMKFEDGIISNNLAFGIPFLENLQNIQTQNKIQVSEQLENCKFKDENIDKELPLNFTIEMETGTGKTYTYLRTIYELNKIYGFKKFVIVVPSVPIREGVMQCLSDTSTHFQQLYGKPSVNYRLYNSNRKQPRDFAVSNAVEILVINIDSFAKDTNIINKKDEHGSIPIDYIQKCNPIVIVDEPQNMETDIRKTALSNLNPICTLRYSATHKNYYNLLYSLNPVEAYDLGLVKQIEVDGITAEREDYNRAFIEVKDILHQGNGLKAKLKIYVNDANSIKSKEISVKTSDDLYEKSNRKEMYSNRFIVSSMNINENSISFSNGLKLYKGQQQGGLSDEIMRFQIEQTIKNHFEKELKLKKKGIKVLSLFFIDRVANYRGIGGEKGKFALWFEEYFNLHKPENYLYSVDNVHNGYFAQDDKKNFKDSKEKTTEADNLAYELIMRDKKRLLDETEPLRFIFSHSALREGWDNPNVFQICTLNETHSEMKKRQEIGRGMRLPVNNKGNRCWDKEVNILTIIANETYAEFSASLQKEIEEDTSVKFEGRIKDKRERVKIEQIKALTKENYPEFFELWDKIKQHTRYKIDFCSNELIKNSIEEINKMPTTKEPILVRQKSKLKYEQEGIVGMISDQEIKCLAKKKYNIPNVFAYIQSKIDITKKTISKILLGIEKEKLHEIFINPQMFLDNVVIAIRTVLNELLVNGIEYETVEDKYFDMSLLDEVGNEYYKSNLILVENNMDRTLFNYISCDSDIEKDFAEDCQTMANIKFYCKLPKRDFHIPTPVGPYHPDWALVVEKHGEQKIYFIAETKSTTNLNELRPDEAKKIRCGKKWNEKVTGVEYKHVVKVNELL